MPPPSPAPPEVCVYECSDAQYHVAGDGVCDDGGPDSEYAICAWGTDCADCGFRRVAPIPPPAPPLPPLSPPSLPPAAPPILLPRSPALPESAAQPLLLRDASGVAVPCTTGLDCTFVYALSLTPVLLSWTPSSGNQGDILLVTGHTLSLTASENQVFVGGESCEVLTAQQSTSFTPPECPVATCTQEMRTVVELTCRLPHLDSLVPHTVSIATTAGGYAPTVASATVTTPPQLRSISPTSGSIAGGTTLTLSGVTLSLFHTLSRSPSHSHTLSPSLAPLHAGDGFSPRRSDLEVTVGGLSCRVLSTNATTVLCVTSVAAVLTEDSGGPLLLSVRGAAASCIAPSCEFTYSQARTPILAGVTATNQDLAQWTLTLSGSFGDGSNFPVDSAEVWIGSGTQCVPTTVSASTLECVADPPSAGQQMVSVITSWGLALGTSQPTGERRRLVATGLPVLPALEGAAFAVTSVSPTSTSLAGGTTLTVTGTSFSTDTAVRVCGDACQVTSASSTSVTCVAPSSLHHASGRQILTLSDVSSLEIEPHELGYTPAPPPVPPAMPSPGPLAPPPPPQPLAPPPQAELVAANTMCYPGVSSDGTVGPIGDNDNCCWTGQKNLDPEDCMLQVLARDPGTTSHVYFNHATGNDGNCFPIAAATDCTVTTPGNSVVAARDLVNIYRINPAPPAPPPSLPTSPPWVMTAAMSSKQFGQYETHDKAIDGDVGTYCQSDTESDPWLSIGVGDGSLISIGMITIYNRQDWPPYFGRFGHHQIWIGHASGQHEAPAELCADATAPSDWDNGAGPFFTDCGGMLGSYVTIVLPGSNRILHLAEVEIEATYSSPSPPPSPPSPPPSPPWDVAQAIALRSKVIQLNFTELTPTNLPRGSSLRSAVLKVTPHSGSTGAFVAALGAVLDCGAGPIGSANATVEWDVQPWLDDLLEADQAPDLVALLATPISQRDPAELQKCAVVLTIMKSRGTGQRAFYAPHAPDVVRRPQLELVFDAPTTAEQLSWATSRACDVTVAVPVPIAADEACHPVNAALGLPLSGTSSCPHLQLTATAATTTQSCAMTVNGLDLFAGCGLDRLVTGRDGVCVAQLGAGETNPQPRAACFDTQTEGEGVEQLAAWVDKLPDGAPVLLVSCSRLAWRYSLERVSEVLESLGGLDPPAYLDDAYALIGAKGRTSALAEARTQCCEDREATFGHCLTCDQTRASANASVACGLPIGQGNTASILGDTYHGGFGSASQIAALADLEPPHVQSQNDGYSIDAADAIAMFQTSDADVFDAECQTDLVAPTSEPYGVRLATDGDASTYWLSSGAPDAAITIDLGFTRQLTNLTFEWKSPAYSVLVLYSTQTAGDDWRLGGILNKPEAPPVPPPSPPMHPPWVMTAETEALKASPPSSVTVVLSDGGANAAVGISARRLRVYMADAADAANPVFALRELIITSCGLSELAGTIGTQLAYELALTPIVASISPVRGSTAGGTLITLQVDGLPSGIDTADVHVTVVGLPCAVTSVSATATTNRSEVACLTSSHGKTSAANPGVGPVELTLPSMGTAAATQNAVYSYIDLWSRYSTWGGEYVTDWTGNLVKNTIPGLETTGDTVWIQTGQRLLLDCDISVYLLIVQGDLEFDRKDVHLNANYIFVMGGSFAVGSEDEPFLQRAVITLHGSPISQEIPVYGAKTLSCRLCTLDLHGRPVLDGRTHTKLAQTARAGDTELVLTEPVDWDPLGGIAEVLVTSSAESGSMEEFDRVGLFAVLDDGYRLKLSTPLQYDHLGETRHFADGFTIDLRCNVALLSRNVVIQGDAISELDRHGGHIMLHSRGKPSIVDRSQGESLTARIENIEVRRMGQLGRLGRYSIHFHMIGAVRNSYVRYNVIRHTYSRAIAIHGVHYLRVQNNGAVTRTRTHVSHLPAVPCLVTGAHAFTHALRDSCL